MSNKKCPNCGYELDSWNDCVSVNNILECPECEEHFELKAVTLNQPQFTIPKSIADELREAIGATNFESTPYSVKLDEDGYLKMWASLRHKKLSEKTYKFCRDNTRVFAAYLNPLTRDLVKVVEG